MGTEWNAKVDTNHIGTHILWDIASCSLSQVDWVVPNGSWSDCPGPHDQYGPSWVAAVINAIGNNPTRAVGTQDAGSELLGKHRNAASPHAASGAHQIWQQSEVV
jgi:hypothetical protein